MPKQNRKNLIIVFPVLQQLKSDTILLLLFYVFCTVKNEVYSILDHISTSLADFRCKVSHDTNEKKFKNMVPI